MDLVGNGSKKGCPWGYGTAFMPKSQSQIEKGIVAIDVQQISQMAPCIESKCKAWDVVEAVLQPDGTYKENHDCVLIHAALAQIALAQEVDEE